jgi:16S rRNA C1402 N4-methylase RsmH
MKVLKNLFCEDSAVVAAKGKKIAAPVSSIDRRLIATLCAPSLISQHGVCTILDASFGAGRHTRSLLKHAKKLARPCPVRVIGYDKDNRCKKRVRQLSHEFGDDKFRWVCGTWRDLPSMHSNEDVSDWIPPSSLSATPEKYLHGMVIELGASPQQLELAERGFAITNFLHAIHECAFVRFSSLPGPLDMRMNQLSDKITAHHILSTYSFDELVKMFIHKGGETVETGQSYIFG